MRDNIAQRAHVAVRDTINALSPVIKTQLVHKQLSEQSPFTMRTQCEKNIPGLAKCVAAERETRERKN